MRTSSMVIGTLTSLAAGVTGVLAYAVLAPVPTAPAPGTDRPPALAAHADDAARPVVRFRPCPVGTRVEDGFCVTRVVRKVVVRPASPSASAASPAVVADEGESDDTLTTGATPVDDDEAEDAPGTDDEPGDEEGEGNDHDAVEDEQGGDEDPGEDDDQQVEDQDDDGGQDD